MQYVIQHYLPYILASTCWQWGSSSDADTCRQWGSSSDAVSMEVDQVGTTSADDLFVLLQLVENMRPLNASAAEAVLVEGSALQPSTSEEAVISHMPVLAEAGRMFSYTQLTKLTSIFQLHSLSSAFSIASQCLSHLSANTEPPPSMDWSCSGVVVWIGKARVSKFGSKCVVVKLTDLDLPGPRTELVTLFVGEAADAFLGRCPGPSRPVFTNHCATHNTHCLLPTHHSLPTTHHSPLTTHHSPFTTYYSLLTTHYSLIATLTRCSLLTFRAF
jgi:hypothetical protein